MIILPAIDIKNGQCVRLLRGDFGTAERVAEDPLAAAAGFRAAGAEWVHMVDLDGAREGKPVNTGIFLSVAAESGLKVEVGGGIRDLAAIEFYVNSGVSRVILGSAALSNPGLVKEAVRRYGDRIAVGIDARDRKVAADGWLKTSSVDFIDLAKAVEAAGVTCIIFTDISKDGTLSGPNLAQLEEMNTAVSCDIIASGGVTDLHDIESLIRLELYGAICGKSIYKGTLDLAEAIRKSGRQAE